MGNLAIQNPSNQRAIVAAGAPTAPAHAACAQRASARARAAGRLLSLAPVLCTVLDVGERLIMLLSVYKFVLEIKLNTLYKQIEYLVQYERQISQREMPNGSFSKKQPIGTQF